MSDYNTAPKMAHEVTPSDANNLPWNAEVLYVGGAGDVAVVPVTGSSVVFSSVPAGTQLRIRCKQVLSTGTTATDIVALGTGY